MLDMPQIVSSANAWIALILGFIAVSGAFFGIATYVVRTKDMQTFKPLIEGIPMLQKELADQGKALAEMKGVMSVIPAIQAHQEHARDDILKLEARMLKLESKT